MMKNTNKKNMSKKNTQKNTNNSNNTTTIVVVIAACIIILGFAIFTFTRTGGDKSSDISIGTPGTTNNTVNSGSSNNVSETNRKETVNISESGKLVIPISEVTSKATFYPINVDGTDLEVFAVKAPDGSIRTAFNTCQVCYSSGRGYYIQKGDKLVCQNCGNKFATSDVEVNRNGCNPVPITGSDKTVDEENITISKEFLEEYKIIFENWKNEF